MSRVRLGLVAKFAYNYSFFAKSKFYKIFVKIFYFSFYSYIESVAKVQYFFYISIRMTLLIWISDVFIRVSGVDPPYLHSWALIRSITAKSAKSAKFVIQRKTANFFKPHLADLAVTVNLHFRLAISVLKNLINSAAKL